jgi:hypothetical protein
VVATVWQERAFRTDSKAGSANRAVPDGVRHSRTMLPPGIHPQSIADSDGSPDIAMGAAPPVRIRNSENDGTVNRTLLGTITVSIETVISPQLRPSHPMGYHPDGVHAHLIENPVTGR